MVALVGYGLLFIILSAFVLPVLARSWRSLFILGGISFMAALGGWLNYYFVSLSPEKFNDVSALWEQAMLLGLTGLSIGLCVFTALRLKGWPSVDNIWLARGARLAALLTSGVASFYALGFLSYALLQDRHEAAWNAFHSPEVTLPIDAPND